MTDIKDNVYDTLKSTMFCFVWSLNEDNVIDFECGCHRGIQRDALKILLNRQDVLNDIMECKNNREPLSKAYKVEIDNQTLFIQLTGMNNNKDVMCGIGTDVTEQKMKEIKMHRMVYYDSLTGLDNRLSIGEFLEREISRSLRGLTRGAVFFLDLDKFKQVNDEYGHAYGDMLLKEVANRLTGCVRKYDLAGRISGDEFIIVQTDIKSIADVKAMANKILNAFSYPWQIEGRSINIYASLGICLYPQDGKTAEKLIRNADAAMYQSKNMSGNRYTFFTNEIQSAKLYNVSERLSLQEAINKGELIVYYQPQIDLKNDRISGIEALLRWNRPGYGIVKPLNFIDVAEESDIIIQIGKYTVDKALQDLQKLARDCIFNGNLILNYTIKQFRSSELLEYTKERLEYYDLSKSYLTMEIYESTIKDLSADAIEKLAKYIKFDVNVALDKFEITSDELKKLTKLKVSGLKIGKGIIPNIKEDRDIVMHMVAMGHKYNINVIAEGIETEAQLIELIGCGCDGYQGYYFCEPVPFDKLYQYIRSSYSSVDISHRKWIR